MRYLKIWRTVLHDQLSVTNPTQPNSTAFTLLFCNKPGCCQASISVQELFGAEIKVATIKLVNYQSPGVAYNNGKGHFRFKKLPLPVQLSSVNALKIIDVNQKVYPDIIAIGNFMDLIPQFCSVDASYGHILLNDKKGGFLEMSPSAIGINVPKQKKGYYFCKI